MDTRVIKGLMLAVALLGIVGCGGKELPDQPETTETAITQPAQILETQPPQTESAPTEPEIERFVFTFAGDCTFGATPSNYNLDIGFPKTVGEDYGYPFANVIEYLENDEFTMVNLEGPLTDRGYPAEKKHVFQSSAAFVNILTENSVEAVTIANNHTMDYGNTGYQSTLETLENAGVPYVERDSSTLVTTKNGLTVGLYAAVYYKLDVEDMTEEIAALKEQGADVIIFAPHWGAEGVYRPTEEQKRVGRAAIDAGADIVFGSHPHVLQPVERYGDGIIYYSLGNFSFGGNIYPRDLDTALMCQEVIREDGQVRLGELTIIPASVSSVSDRNNFQPTPFQPGTEDYERVMSKLDGTFDGPNLKIQ